MKTNDLASKAIRLAVAGVLAGSGLALAQSAGNAPKTTPPAAKDKSGCGGPNGCGSTSTSTKAAAKPDKHVCKGLNSCKGKGGCASKQLQHDCKGMNACKSQGGCKSGENGCAGKNSCKGKGGCQVPVKDKAA